MECQRWIARLILVAWFCLKSAVLLADLPGIINYQGRLVIAGTNYDGTAQFKFMLVDGAGTNAFWSNEGPVANVAPPATFVSLSVARGLYAVLLGDTNLPHMAGIPSTVFTNGDVRLRVWVSTDNDFSLLIPDVRIAPVGYAFRAQSAVTADRANLVANFTGELSGDVTGNQRTTVVTRVGGASAAAIAAGVNAANAATSANTPGSIVQRDAGGNFSAGTVTGTFSGSGAGLTGLNAGNIASGTLADGRLSIRVPLLNANQTFNGANTFAGVARLTNPGNLLAGKHLGDGSGLSNLVVVSVGSFTGLLEGDVEGSQKATVVTRIGGASAAAVASGANAANAATSANVPGTTVQRDAGGNFSAGTITGVFSGSGTALTGLDAGNVASGTLADGRLSSNVPLLNADQTFSGANTFAGVAHLTNSENILVGTHAGDGSGLSNLPYATAAGGFLGTLSGDVQGTQGATVVSQVGGANAVAIASGANAANAATSANTPGSIVQRDGGGSFSAGTVTGTFSGSGAGLTGLDAGRVASGTLADGRLSSNVPLLNAAQTFSGANTFAGVARLTNNGNILVGTHTGDGSGLVNINASSISGLANVAVPAGSLVVSSLAQDSALIAAGYGLTTTIPSPAWANGSPSGALGARYGHTAVWDGAEMILWGGAIGPGQDASGGALYHPDTDVWQLVSTVGAPSPRSGHTAVWTGSQLIIWGGTDVTGYAPTGGRFAPATGLWSPISTSVGPSPRSGHIAVWTGSSMVVWGGINADGLLNDGALYAPGLDQWASLGGISSPPSARSGATAVWTGDRLIVWGGQGAGGLLGDGAELVFSISGLPLHWTALSGSGAPPPRQGHSAVWTGTKMIIWGGRNAIGPLADGAAYDPASGSWEPLPALNAPAARSDHAAVWTGQDMLIVAGTGAAGELAAAFSYTPSTARWSSLSASGGPMARTAPAAVWSGTELLVFGGRANGQPVGFLQRLVPQPTWYFYRKL